MGSPVLYLDAKSARIAKTIGHCRSIKSRSMIVGVISVGVMTLSPSVYPLRNGNGIILPFCRLSSTSDSFIPSTIKMWNRLSNNIRNVDTLSKFKSELKKIDETENHSVHKHFFCGPRN